MPSGVMPTYGYVPPQRPGVEAQLRTCSSRRARLFKGGTYFRSRGLGLQQNLLSVEVVEFAPPTAGTPDGVCVVVNHVNLIAENLTGPATASLLKVSLPYNEYVEIDQLDTPAPRARLISISAQIGATPGQIGPDMPFSFSRVFSIPRKLSAKLIPGSSVFTPTDRIIIKPRFVVHRLETEVTTPTDPMLPSETVWSIKKLRTQVNANDPWIEMLERSGPTDDGMGGPPIPNPNPADVQDTGTDADRLGLFAQTFLGGGDGLPDTPNNEVTGPTRSIVHVNYGEAPNGALREVNVVYEWVGDSATSGAWATY